MADFGITLSPTTQEDIELAIEDLRADAVVPSSELLSSLIFFLQHLPTSLFVECFEDYYCQIFEVIKSDRTAAFLFATHIYSRTTADDCYAYFLLTDTEYQFCCYLSTCVIGDVAVHLTDLCSEYRLRYAA